MPGQDRLSALLDVARTVVRRAERAAVPVAADGSPDRPLPQPPLVGAVDPRPLGRGRTAARPRRALDPTGGSPCPSPSSSPAPRPPRSTPSRSAPSPGRPRAAASTGRFLAAQGFEAKKGDVRAVPGADGGTTFVVGLGPAAEVDADVLRSAAGALARAAKRQASLAVDLLGALREGVDAAAAAQAIAEGLVLGGYQYAAFKSEPKPGALAPGHARRRRRQARRRRRSTVAWCSPRRCAGPATS